MRINTGFTQSNNATARVVDMSINEYNECVQCVATAPSGVYQVFSKQRLLLFRAFYDPDVTTGAQGRRRANGRKRAKSEAHPILTVADDQLQLYVNLATPSPNGKAITNMSDLNMPVYVSDQLCSTAFYAARSQVGSTSRQLQRNRAIYAAELKEAVRCIRQWLTVFAQHPAEENWYRACLGVGQWCRHGNGTCVLQMDLLTALDTAWPIATMLSTKLLKGCVPHSKLRFGFYVYRRCWLAPHYNGRSAVCVTTNMEDCIATATQLYLSHTVTSALANPDRSEVPQLHCAHSAPVKRPACLQLTNPRYYPLAQGLKHQRRRQMSLVAKAVFQATGQTLFTSAYFDALCKRGFKRESVKSLITNVAADLATQKRIQPASCQSIRHSSGDGMRCPFASTDRCAAQLKRPEPSEQNIIMTPVALAIGWTTRGGPGRSR